MARQRLDLSNKKCCPVAPTACGFAVLRLSSARSEARAHFCGRHLLQHGPGQPPGSLLQIHPLARAAHHGPYFGCPLCPPPPPRAHRGRFAWPPAGPRSNFHVLHVTVGGVGCTVVFYQLLEEGSDSVNWFARLLGRTLCRAPDSLDRWPRKSNRAPRSDGSWNGQRTQNQQSNMTGHKRCF